MLSVFMKYLRGEKCHFFMTPDQKNDRHEIVVLVHGLIRRSLNLYVMGKYLRKAGYTVYIYDYQTTVKSITGHGKDFKQYLEKIAEENPSEIPINLVTHSMGGIITRI
ncbi:MAG: alpha/beta hydrolase, partial [Victivallaceae bacterium]